MSVRVAVALGSNLGSPEGSLLAAAAALERVPGLRPVALSSGYWTAPVGPEQPPYLNAALVLQTALGPREVLAALQGVEAALGRRRGIRWGPRLIDLDLLLHGDQVVAAAPRLEVPHPRLRERAFALVPLVEVWPTARDPIHGDRYVEVLGRLDQSGVGPPRPLPERVRRRPFDHTADMGFEVSAKDHEGLIEGAALALVDTLVRRHRVKERQRRVIQGRGADPVERLIALLSELHYLVDGLGFAPRRVSVLRLEPDRVKMAVYGERLRDEGQLRTAVKAVTYHGAVVEQSRRGAGVRARVVLDV